MKDNIFKSSNHQEHDQSSFHDDAFEMIDTSAAKATKKHETPKADNAEMLNTLNEITRRTDAVSCGTPRKPSPKNKKK